VQRYTIHLSITVILPVPEGYDEDEDIGPDGFSPWENWLDSKLDPTDKSFEVDVRDVSIG
jgi:hypothetical protein